MKKLLSKVLLLVGIIGVGLGATVTVIRKLDDVPDVRTPSPSNGQVLVWNSAGYWTNGNAGSASSTNSTVYANGSTVIIPNFKDSATATFTTNLGTNILVNPTNITDAQIVSVTTRSKLPSAIAYEDEVNVFSATNVFQTTSLPQITLRNSGTSGSFFSSKSASSNSFFGIGVGTLYDGTGWLSKSTNGYMVEFNNTTFTIDRFVGGTIGNYWVNSDPLFIITSTGNIGIGTGTPATFKLETAGSIGPKTDSSYDLGSSGRRWANGYFSQLYVDAMPDLSASRAIVTDSSKRPISASGTADASTFLNGGGSYAQVNDATIDPAGIGFSHISSGQSPGSLTNSVINPSSSKFLRSYSTGSAFDWDLSGVGVKVVLITNNATFTPINVPTDTNQAPTMWMYVKNQTNFTLAGNLPANVRWLHGYGPSMPTTNTIKISFDWNGLEGILDWSAPASRINDSATNNPTTSDDSTLGYQRGSYWVNTSTPSYWVLLNQSAGAAVWTNLTANTFSGASLSGTTTNAGVIVHNTSTLAYSGSTNLIVNLATANSFKVTVTNTAFVYFTNIPASGQDGTWFIKFLNDGTGGYSVTHTNVLTQPGATALTIYTNANKYTLWTVTMNTFTNGLLWGTTSTNF